MELWQVLLVGVVVISSVTSIFLFFENNSLRNRSNVMNLEELPELNKAEYDEKIVLSVISDTEYSPSEEGQLIIRVTDVRSRPLTSLCFGSVAYPDKSLFITNQSMSSSAFSGNYYLNFSVPSTYGVYEEYVECYVNVSYGLAKATRSSSFHVTNISAQLANLNSTIFSELTQIQTDIANAESNITISLTNVQNTLISQMLVYYNSIINAISNLPTNIIGSFETQAPNWFSCVARTLTGVYPPDGKCQ